jgi:hypothetical protein
MQGSLYSGFGLSGSPRKNHRDKLLITADFHWAKLGVLQNNFDHS